MQLRRRKDFFPKRLVDIFCFLFIAILFPIVSLFDIIVVLPAVHSPQTLTYKFIFALSIFLVYNIMANLFATMTVDTSVNAININTKVPPSSTEEDWFKCSYCNKLAPPRSYHCKVCTTCIIKRDHHCVFTGCCIGHCNIRFFALFLFYLFIGSLISFCYLNYYMFELNGDTFLRKLSFYKMTFPILLFSALVISTVLLIYHGIPILKGGTSFERRLNYPYSNGLYNNFKDIFGKRMYLAWISPFISSELLDNGVSVLTNKPNQRPSRKRSRSRRKSYL
ncbi:putative ZDHHC-type palmitoyltransferase 4 isoform X2 [Eurosta solidaginis]|uniref:putative ZDHHC-type palmitoyltransferase 4 isoform X2 n=1 Tax=Eurosta solidaginis TaxID=178769 RepID=UPI0035307DD9